MQVKSVPESAFLTVAMRWSDRLIGLISVIILARLLVPEDFGIVVMASVIVGLIDILLDLGVNTALIQNKDTDDDDFSTAWTLRLIQSILAGIIIFISAPWVADYYNNLLVIDVLRVMAFSVIIAGLENIGVVSFQKNMEFGKDFKFFFCKRISGFIITLIVAFILQSYWAMVIGALVGRIVGVLLSYKMHEFRPHLQLKKFSSIWSFSKWVLLRNIGSYLDNQSDKLLIGHRNDAGTLGAYSVAKDVAAMPTSELLAPLGRVLFPAFVQKRDNEEVFVSSISTAIGVQVLIAFPACVGLSLVAEDAVPILLGANWGEAVPFIQTLAFINLLFSLSHSSGYALLAIGKIKLLAAVTWLQAILFLSTVIWFFPQSDAMAIIMIRLCVVGIGTIAVISITLVQIRGFGASDYFLPLIRPLLATFIMAFVLINIHPELASMAVAIRLILEILIGCLAYVGSIIFLWLIIGRPEGAESYLLKNFLYKFG